MEALLNLGDWYSGEERREVNFYHDCFLQLCTIPVMSKLQKHVVTHPRERHWEPNYNANQLCWNQLCVGLVVVFKVHWRRSWGRELGSPTLTFAVELDHGKN
eukprot:7831542-Ditylum_brightwellii.AAC.1